MSVWSTHYVKGREMLERVQCRLTRMVPGLRGLDYGMRLERLGLLTFEERRNRLDLVELFKISMGLSAIPWDLFFWAGSSKRTRGHSRKLAKESSKLEEFFITKSGQQLEWVE